MYKGLPKLFKLTGTGALQEWCIGTDDNVIVTRWGQTDGAIQESRDTVLRGKNGGKSNATTPEQQAEKEAYAQWEKKLKSKKYVRSVEEARAGTSDALVKGGVDVMLAKEYNEHAGKVKFPCYLQPKLDGHRCIAVVADRKCTLWSRTRKEITGVPHINRVVEKLAQASQYPNIILDGELYEHDYRNKFEELTSFIRQDTPKPGHEVVQYWVFDLVQTWAQTTGGPNKSTDFKSRSSQLRVITEFAKTPEIVLVESLTANNVFDIDRILDRYLAEGFEGVIVRNADAPYEGKRTHNLLKLKKMQDAEFRVVNVEDGRGKMKGLGIFVCETADGKEFRVKMKGELKSLREYFDNQNDYIGRMLTVQFQGYTDDGSLRFPVGLRIAEKL